MTKKITRDKGQFQEHALQRIHRAIKRTLDQRIDNDKRLRAVFIYLYKYFLLATPWRQNKELLDKHCTFDKTNHVTLR